MKTKAIVKANMTWNGSGDNLWLYKNNYLCNVINIDRTYFGREWCERHDMVVTEEVEAENGERFAIYRKADELICAIPIEAA